MNHAALRAPVAVSLGAIGGALIRYYLGNWLVQTTGVNDFPVGTFAVNLLGCFLMGIFVAAGLKTASISPELRLLVATGFLGSLTTFSSYGLDTANLVEAPGWWQDGLYWLGSPVLGWFCLQAGLALGNALLPSQNDG